MEVRVGRTLSPAAFEVDLLGKCCHVDVAEHCDRAMMKRQNRGENRFGLAWPARFSWPMPARAHNGPPFPIIENHKVGPCIISLWTHPDVGTGTFFVFVQPLPGATVPKDLKVQIGVQPESGRLPEVVYTSRPGQQSEASYNTTPSWSLIATSFGGCAWSWKVRRAAERNFRVWKRLRWVSENGICCFFCYLSWLLRSCGFGACPASEAG